MRRNCGNRKLHCFGNHLFGQRRTVEELEAESVTATGEPEIVTIYYGSSVGKELSTEEVEVPRKTPETIIGELRKKEYCIG